jgi:hypothetical protein
MQIHIGKFGDRRAMSCLLAILCVPLAALADEPSAVGRVRITDSADAAQPATGVEPAGFLRRSEGDVVDGSADCPYCRRRGGGAFAADAPAVTDGTITTDGAVVDGYGANGRCFGGRRFGANGRCLGCGLGLGGCRCPITNIRPAVLAPIGRTDIAYQKYWPNAWNPNRAAIVESRPIQVRPMVYQPTDTTQLGFYYQHVPYWTYQPGRLPPPPVPRWGFSYTASAYGPPPVTQSTTTITPTPELAPAPAPSIQSAPPAPIAPVPEARFGSRKFYD